MFCNPIFATSLQLCGLQFIQLITVPSSFSNTWTLHVCLRIRVYVHACLRVCMRVYAHLNMRTKFTKHSGQRARIYVQLIACKCTGTKGCGFTLQRMIGYIQQLYPLGITAEGQQV